MSNTVPEQQSEIVSSEQLQIDVKRWPDISLSDWKKWGFDINQVLRTPRNNPLLNPKAPTAFIKSGDNPALVLRGEWYSVNAQAERHIAQMAWPIYIMAVILFAAMLSAVSKSFGFGAALLFIAMYLLLELFPRFSYRITSNNSRASKVEIPWQSANRIVSLPREGIIMVGWEEKSIKQGVALRLSPDSAEELVENISTFLKKGLVHVYNNETHRNPPKQL